MKSLTILIGGDLVPTRSNYSFFSEGDIRSLVDKKLLSLMNSADCRIFNLEVPLTDTRKPIKKDGPNNMAPVSTVKGIKSLNPTVLSIANNHIMDQDEQGLFQTMDQLTRHEITYVGAGENLESAGKPFIFEKEGLKIGIYSCAENEYSIAGQNRGGANPFDPLESLDHIIKLKSICDYVIVLFHGGKEHYRYPSPNLQKICRKMVEKGASLVVCQHSHCVGAREMYNNGMIVYGQGNFLFDHHDNEFWSTSVLIKATFDKKLSVDFIPICKKGNGVEWPSGEKRESILKAFNERSEQISNSGFVQSEYDKFCIKNGQYYLSTAAGFGRILRKVDKMMNGFITSCLYSLKKLNHLQNHIQCEAHRELFLNYLRLKREKK